MKILGLDGSHAAGALTGFGQGGVGQFPRCNTRMSEDMPERMSERMSKVFPTVSI